jgi:hypothetical protein
MPHSPDHRSLTNMKLIASVDSKSLTNAYRIPKQRSNRAWMWGREPPLHANQTHKYHT